MRIVRHRIPEQWRLRLNSEPRVHSLCKVVHVNKRTSRGENGAYIQSVCLRASESFRWGVFSRRNPTIMTSAGAARGRLMSTLDLRPRRGLISGKNTNRRSSAKCPWRQKVRLLPGQLRMPDTRSLKVNHENDVGAVTIGNADVHLVDTIENTSIAQRDDVGKDDGTAGKHPSGSETLYGYSSYKLVLFTASHMKKAHRVRQ